MAMGAQVMAAFTALVYRPGSCGTFLAGPLQESDIWIAYLGIFVKRTVVVSVGVFNAGVRWLQPIDRELDNHFELSEESELRFASSSGLSQGLESHHLSESVAIDDDELRILELQNRRSSKDQRRGET